MIQNIQPRKYQEEIFNTCKDKSCLVVLPTGIGKTLIALMLAVHKSRQQPSKKIIFLAPTRPLAEQHLAYFQKHLPELFATMELFTGKTESPKRRKLWQNADIVFSTPQCVANDLKKKMYDLSDVSLLIEDEAHRCIKNYDYTYVAKMYQEQSQNPHVLGLTASPGSDKARIKDICKNLGINSIEIRTRESEDVKEYLQDLKTEIIKIEFPEELVKIRNLLNAIYERKTNELTNRKLLFMRPTKVSLLECQGKIMKSILSGNKNFNMLAGASACAQAIKLHHAIELLETQTLISFSNYIQELFKQAASKKSKAVQQLVKQPEFNAAYIDLQELIAKKQEHPKLFKLKELVERELKESSKAKIIVFSQFRDTATAICKTLNQIQGVNARVFVGQTKKGETGLSQKEQKEVIEQFALGKINILAATSIGEEGLDIPEVSAVIFYEPIPSAIRKIQRGGRTARLKPGKIITLVTLKTRDEAYYWAAFQKEKSMYKALDGIKKEFEENGVLNFNDKTKNDLNSNQKVLGEFDKKNVI